MGRAQRVQNEADVSVDERQEVVHLESRGNEDTKPAYLADIHKDVLVDIVGEESCEEGKKP